MKRLILFIAVLSLFAFKNAQAQDFIPFSAKAGLEAARQAVKDTTNENAFLVSIQTIWSFGEGTKEYDTVESRERWNGLEYTWEYSFYDSLNDSYYRFQVMQSNDSVFSTTPIETDKLPEWSFNFIRIPDDAWLDSDENVGVKKMAGVWEGTELFFNTSEGYHKEAYNKLLWKFGYFYMGDIFAIVGVDAYTGEILYMDFIGSVQSENPDNLCAYPNPSSSGVTVTSDNFCSQYEMMNIFMSSGKKVGTVLCSPNTESMTIPASTFPSNGQYFLKLSGKKNSVTLPVTIQGR